MNDEINFTAVLLSALVYDDDDDDDDDDEKEQKEEEEVDANNQICRVPYVKLGPNSITLSRSQTRFLIRFPRSCGSATRRNQLATFWVVKQVADRFQLSRHIEI